MSTTISIRLRRDTAANWSAANPILAAGQPGYDTTNRVLKVGDGATAWNSLPAIFSSATLADADYGDITVAGGGTSLTIDSNAVTTAKIANDAVTWAKLQNLTTARLLGRATAGSGDAEEIALGAGLSFSGTTLNAAGGAAVTIVKLAANFSVGNNTFTAVTWDTELRDDAGAWTAGSPTIFTIPSGYTKARFSGYHIYAANSTGIRSCEFQVGTSRRQFGAIGASALDQGPCGYITHWLPVTAGDTFRQGAYQNSGGALNLLGSASGDYAWFQVELLP